MARQLRRFGHKSQAIRSLFSGLIGGGAAVWAAYHGFGVWSLVVQRFVTDIITVITAWHAFRWLPRPPASTHDIAEILPFSIHISLSKLTTAFITSIQDISIGFGAGPGGVGLYRLARRTNAMLVKATITPLSTVSVNLFVALRDDQVKFRSAFSRLFSISCIMTFPAFFGTAAVADLLVPLLFGEKWRGSIIILQMLAPICVPMVISLYVLPLLTAFGRANKASEMTTIQLVAAVIISFISAPFGVYAVVGGFLLRTYMILPYQVSIIRHHTGLSASELLKFTGKPLLAAGIMSAFCYGAVQMMPDSVLPIFSLAIIVAAGVALYGVLVVAIDRTTARWAIEMVRNKLTRKRTVLSSEAAQ